MRRFAALFDALDASTATGDKVAALVRYFARRPAADAAWAVYFLAGGKPRQVVPTALLRSTACAAAGIDDWLFEASYQAVGDLAETIAHVLPPPARHSDLGLAHWVEQRLLPLRGLAPDEQAARCCASLDELDGARALPAGQADRRRLSRGRQQAAGAARAGPACGLDAKRVAQRLMGWTDARASVSAERFQRLVAPTPTAPPMPGSPTRSSWRTRCRPSRPRWARWRLAGRMEVRRHPRAAGASRRRLLDLVARRRADDRALPRGGHAGQGLPDGTVLDGELLVWREGRARRRRRSACCSSASAARR
jgi:DNA ligase-1